MVGGHDDEHAHKNTLGNRKNKRPFWANKKVPKGQRGVNHANQRFENGGVSPARRTLPALVPRMLPRIATYCGVLGGWGIEKRWQGKGQDSNKHETETAKLIRQGSHRHF